MIRIVKKFAIWLCAIIIAELLSGAFPNIITDSIVGFVSGFVWCNVWFVNNKAKVE